MAQLPVDLAGMPDGTDVEAMRRWVRDVFQSEGWAREKARFQIKRRRPTTSISKTIESVPCPDTSGEHFDLWIYEPQSTAIASEPRPVLLMFHGGGWIHGSPIADEGTSLDVLT